MRAFKPGAVSIDPLAQQRRRPPPRPTDRLDHHFAKKESAPCSPSSPRGRRLARAKISEKDD
jgi:hypothetical protein